MKKCPKYHENYKENYIYMVFEWADENLAEKLKREQDIREKDKYQIDMVQLMDERVKMAEMLIEGLNALYEKGFLHRDFKF